jgi:hypothetical protein
MSTPAFSVHVYSPPLTEMNFFRQAKDTNLLTRTTTKAVGWDEAV